ncbi:MAG: hypothetical protein EXQ83_09045 [Xanthobacteraceae bacterium]|nr:hypothetical protein [Xanthobacteraceae bacterium]
MIAAPTQPKLPLRRLACGRCGTTFECGTGGSGGGCWCMDEATRRPMPDAAGEDCLCPACVREAATSGRSA